jgi:Uma2 family endonuclease
MSTMSHLTAPEYLAWERAQADRHEFHDGEVFAMAGGSPRHNWIAARVQSELMRALGDRCFVFTPDQRIVVDDGKRYVYPDASVVCGAVELQAGTTDVVANPAVLVEVLSRTTEAYDRGLKWEGYQRLASVTDYLLLAQHEVRVEHFRRGPDRGWFYAALGAGERIVLAGGAALDVDAICARALELPGD